MKRADCRRFVITRIPSGIWSRLYGLLTQWKICASGKSGPKFTKVFRGCYPLRPLIMSNLIEIGQTSLEIWGCQLGLGQFTACIIGPHCLQCIDAKCFHRCRTIYSDVVSMSVSVRYNSQLRKNGWTDWDTVCGAESSRPIEPCSKWGSSPPTGWETLRGTCRNVPLMHACTARSSTGPPRALCIVRLSGCNDGCATTIGDAAFFQITL